MINWLNGIWKINKSDFQGRVAFIQNTLDSAGEVSITTSNPGSDIFKHVYREWNTEADELTWHARKQNKVWQGVNLKRKPIAIRGHFDGGVSPEETAIGWQIEVAFDLTRELEPRFHTVAYSAKLKEKQPQLPTASFLQPRN